MDSDSVDHYDVLGLPSGEGGAELTEKEISKAYRLRALELHPDKRPDDPNAHANFQKLKTSYEILKDEKARRLFDDLLRVKREKIKRELQHDAKRRKMTSDLEERERSGFKPDENFKAQQEEERIARKLKEEISRIRAMHAKKSSGSEKEKETVAGDKGRSENKSSLDKEKVIKVSWEKFGVDYTAQRLREIFAEFGDVEDVAIKSSKKKGSALVVMASKEAVSLALGNVLGELSNPLLVTPLVSDNPSRSPLFGSASVDVEPEEGPKMSNLVGAGFQAFEDSVLEKMMKAAQRQKMS